MELIAAAISEAFEPVRLLLLLTGVLAGLVVGVIPGLSGIFGMALLVPFTYTMDPFAAVALLLGLAAVTTTSDTIPAVLIGVPGTVGAIATTIDGHAMAQNNMASRALAAAYGASLIGGIFGALVLAVSIPLLAPVVLAMRTPDFLASGLLGLGAISILVGGSPLKGLAAALLGVLLALIGLEANSAAHRWTFGQIYLWDGLPVAVVFLGLFGLPELANLLARKSIAGPQPGLERGGLRRGLGDAIREWRLVFQGSGLGAVLGAIPGVSLSIVGWIAYGLATRDRRGGPEFGDGNVRGVIGPESAANATEGGGLIPTLALGLPSGPMTALLLGALIIQGLVPGPEMLTEKASITLSMVFYLCLANIAGALICILATPALARVATVPAAAVVAVALCFVTWGAYQTQASAGDLVTLLCLGLIGWVMRAQNWSRPAFALGFILGPILEHYVFLSWQIHGTEMLLRPSLVMVFLVLTSLAVWKMVRATASVPVQRHQSARPLGTTSQTATIAMDRVIAFVLVVLAGFVLISAQALPLGAAILPRVAGGGLLIVSLGVLWMVRKPGTERVSLDPKRWQDMARFFGVAAALCGGLYLIGAVPSSFLLVLGVMRVIGRVGLRASLITSVAVAALVHLVFDRMIHVAWPSPLLF